MKRHNLLIFLGILISILIITLYLSSIKKIEGVQGINVSTPKFIITKCTIIALQPTTTGQTTNAANKLTIQKIKDTFFYDENNKIYEDVDPRDEVSYIKDNNKFADIKDESSMINETIELSKSLDKTETDNIYRDKNSLSLNNVKIYFRNNNTDYYADASSNIIYQLYGLDSQYFVNMNNNRNCNIFIQIKDITSLNQQKCNLYYYKDPKDYYRNDWSDKKNDLEYCVLTPFGTVTIEPIKTPGTTSPGTTSSGTTSSGTTSSVGTSAASGKKSGKKSGK
jgi:hypothetical protein